MASPKISVIIPIYNAGRFLQNTVNSVTAQTLIDFELILVNDGSTDNSGIICDEYAKTDSRVKVIHKDNGGVNSARWRGVRDAVGNWVTFVDADDIIDENALELLYRVILSDNPLYPTDIVISGTSENSLDKQRFIEAILRGKVAVVCWGKLYKRDLLQEFTFAVPRETKTGEDLLINLRVATCADKLFVKCIENSVYRYSTTTNPNSISKSFTHNEKYEQFFYGLLLQSFTDEKMKNNYMDSLIFCRLNALKLIAMENNQSVDRASKFFIELAKDIKYARYSLSISEYGLLFCLPLYKSIVFLHRIKEGLIRRIGK